jgi:hypothetical protein
MNACDHPHGGGRGKSKGNKHPRSVFGWLTKGKRTRRPRDKDGNKMCVVPSVVLREADLLLAGWSRNDQEDARPRTEQLLRLARTFLRYLYIASYHIHATRSVSEFSFDFVNVSDSPRMPRTLQQSACPYVAHRDQSTRARNQPHISLGHA